MEAEHIAKELEIAGKVECMAKKPAYITLKDRTENFNIYPKCHLINPAKIELGKVAKIIVENINKNVRDKLHDNQFFLFFFTIWVFFHEHSRLRDSRGRGRVSI